MRKGTSSTLYYDTQFPAMGFRASRNPSRDKRIAEAGSILIEIPIFVCLSGRLIELVARVPLQFVSQVWAERHIRRNFR